MAHLAPPPNIQEVLQGLRYPASAADILGCAKDHKAASETLNLLRDLPQDRQYANISEINNVLGKVEELTDPEMTYQSTAGSQELEDEARLTGGRHH
mgnify:CR=1 FL=1